METLKVIIELGKGQTYYAYTSGSEHISSYAEGATAEEAKANLLQALEEVKETCAEEGDAEKLAYLEGLNIEYSYDIASFLKYYKLFNITQLAKHIGINDALMRQYKTGQYMSQERAQEIVTALNNIGQELTAIRL